jgi:hypothetical protein
VSTNFTIEANGIVKQNKNSPGDGVTGAVVWRRDPESNRADRICNPVHNRFAIAPQWVAVPTDKKGKPWLPFVEKMEREKSLELSTSTLARLRSTN